MAKIIHFQDFLSWIRRKMRLQRQQQDKAQLKRLREKEILLHNGSQEFISAEAQALLDRFSFKAELARPKFQTRRQ